MTVGDHGLLDITETVAPGFAYTLTPTSMLADFHSPHQHVQLIRTQTFGRVLVLDGSFQCSEADEASYHEPLVHSAMLACPSPRNVLIIGGGDGGAAEEVLKHSEVQRLVHVELDAAVVNVCREHLFNVHHGVLDGTDPRYSLVVEDGFTYLERSVDVFDVIILDLTDPGGPSSRLYAAAFMQCCADHLAPNGTLSLHVGSAWGQTERIGSIAAMLRQAFAHVEPMLVNVPLSGGPWLMAVGSKAAMLADPACLQVQSRWRRMGGRPLQVVTPEVLRAMRTLPRMVSSIWAG